MLNWLGGGGKVDHPMAELKQAREIIADLPANDAIKLLEDVTYWLDSLNHTEGFKADRLYENIDLLDQAAKTAPRKLLQDYLGMSRQQKFQENRLWTLLFNYWRELGTAYLKCIENHESGTATSAAIRKAMPVLVCRALRALGMQLKLSLLRYGPTELRVWEHVGRVYQVAEASDVLDQAVTAYAGPNAGTTTPRFEFLKPLMLAASSTDGLTPVKQEIAERIVNYFAEAFRLERNATPVCHYLFDVTGSRHPERVIAGAAPAPTLRYFGAGDALPRLSLLHASITETGAYPPDLHLGGSYDKQLVLAVIAHLQQYWSDTPPARSSERSKIATRITVVHSLPGLVQVLDSLKADAGVASAGSAAESWIVENVSDGGFGAVIPAAKSDWIRVGTLIGVKAEASPYWGVGVIRRVVRDEQQQRRVGIQMITRTAIPVRVAQKGTSAGFETAPEEAEIGVLLSTTPDKQGEVGVVLREGGYNSRESLDMTVNGKFYLLMPGRLVEGGEDFDWAKFKIMQRSSGEQ